MKENAIDNTVIAVYKALADDMRLAIVRSLASSASPQKNCDVVASCSRMSDLSQPTMSHHIKKLVAADIVIIQKLGTENVYALNKATLQKAGIDPAKLATI